MTLRYGDKVKESATVTGTGAVTLGGAETGCVRFSSVCTVGDTIDYEIYDSTAAAWEIGVGTYSATNTLTRTTVTSNSAGTTALISFAGNACDVFCTLSASRVISLATGRNVDPTADVFNWNPSTQLLNFRAARAQVVAGIAGARCIIACTGDSRTAGVTLSTTNYRDTTSWPTFMVKFLTLNGVPAQGDNFVGNGADQNADNRIVLVNGSGYNGITGFGGNIPCMNGVGQGVNLALVTAAVYDRLDVQYFDSGTGSFTVAVDGGSAITTITLGNTGNFIKTTVTLTSGSHSVANFLATTSGQIWVQGASFWNSTVPKVEVYNGGRGGADSSDVGTGGSTGYGPWPGLLVCKPNLTMIDYGVNDLNNNSPSRASTLAYITLMVTSARAAGSDVIVSVPGVFSSTYYAAGLPAIRSDLENMALAQNVPLIDNSNRYGNNYTTANAIGMMASSLHPSVACYADQGAHNASLLATA